MTTQSKWTGEKSTLENASSTSHPVRLVCWMNWMDLLRSQRGLSIQLQWCQSRFHWHPTRCPRQMEIPYIDHLNLGVPVHGLVPIGFTGTCLTPWTAPGRSAEVQHVDGWSTSPPKDSKIPRGRCLRRCVITQDPQKIKKNQDLHVSRSAFTLTSWLDFDGGPHQITR